MMIPLTLLLAVIGIIFNLSFASSIMQPDWALAFLLAAILAHRQHWRWVLPMILIHDFALFWNGLAIFPWIVLAPLLLIWSDAQLGPAVPQRTAILTFVTVPMLWLNWPAEAWVLTWLLSFCAWYLMTQVRLESA